MMWWAFMAESTLCILNAAFHLLLLWRCLMHSWDAAQCPEGVGFACGTCVWGGLGICVGAAPQLLQDAAQGGECHLGAPFRSGKLIWQQRVGEITYRVHLSGLAWGDPSQPVKVEKGMSEGCRQECIQV